MIGIIFAGNIEYCPYVDKYIDLIKKNNVAYEILYWNRDLLTKNFKYTSQSFDYKIDNSKSRYLKVFDFLMYRNWLINKIKNKKYKQLIILETLSGLLINSFIRKKFSNKYIFDIRDYSYENNKFFYCVENIIINKSFFTCISSDGFKEFLPKNHEYILTHNFSYNDVKQATNRLKIKKQYGEKINIVWIGSIRYYNHQIKLINHIKNDERFNVIIHGTGPDLDRLKTYCISNRVGNILFTGRYDNSQKKTLLESADLLHNSYDVNIGNEVLYAVSNKFYDGIIYKIPQLVEHGTYKQKLVEGLKIGIGLNVESNSFADELYEYYFNIDFDLFSETCDYKLKSILNEDIKYLSKIEDFIKI